MGLFDGKVLEPEEVTVRQERCPECLHKWSEHGSKGCWAVDYNASTTEAVPCICPETAAS